MSDIPLGKNGKPLVRTVIGAQELIPTGQYANVTIGPASVERYCEDDIKVIATTLQESVRACEAIIAEERESVLKMVRGG